MSPDAITHPGTNAALPRSVTKVLLPGIASTLPSGESASSHWPPLKFALTYAVISIVFHVAYFPSLVILPPLVPLSNSTTHSYYDQLFSYTDKALFYGFV
jgi:hypothetical protein